MFRQVCAIEPSFFNTTSGMHRHPFEGRHLVLNLYHYLEIRDYKCNTKKLLVPIILFTSFYFLLNLEHVSFLKKKKKIANVKRIEIFLLSISALYWHIKLTSTFSMFLAVLCSKLRSNYVYCELSLMALKNDRF